MALLIYNIPFAVRPFTAAAPAKTGPAVARGFLVPEETRWMTFWRVTLPLLSWQGYLRAWSSPSPIASGVGVVLMVGGNIPGSHAHPLSIAIYDDVQTLDYASAHKTAFWLLVFSFAVLCVTRVGKARFFSMNELTASFSMRYPSGTSVHADFASPADGFS
ncbi:MAG: hypothetical protein U1D30_02800 [Planctomycetota bacterium]